VVRGGNKTLYSSLTNAEATETDTVTSFNSNGWTMGGNIGINESSSSFVAWAFDAGSSTVTNTAGSISSQVRANATAGFSVVTYTGNGTGGATVGHGLGVAPELLITKSRSASGSWFVYHKSIGNTQYLVLQSTDAEQTSSNAWNNTTPSSTVFTLGAGIQPSSVTQVAYCFAPVVGYSSFGSYTGNGSTDGPFVYTGFRPRFLLVKRTNTTGDWVMIDAARSAYNVTDKWIFANLSDAEYSISQVDFLSNGFKARGIGTNINDSGSTYIYAAFAESPFAANNRAR